MSCTNSDHAIRSAPKATIAWAMGLAMLASAAMAVVILLVVGFWRAEAAGRDQILRGKYLVTLALCTDCHTPGYFFGKPDPSRFLGGSDVGFELPGLGVFHGPNLTPDQDTGLGHWSAADIVRAIQTGTRPDGRILAPIMPWHAFAELTSEDAQSIAAFLKSLPPVSNKVPGPFGPSDTPTSFVFRVVAPQPTQ
jgi:mono/diheme cytochrome c family protein